MEKVYLYVGYEYPPLPCAEPCSPYTFAADANVTAPNGPTKWKRETEHENNKKVRVEDKQEHQ